MPIECRQWPMNLLTRASGEKNRVLLCHPKAAVERKGIRRDDDGKLMIIDPKAIKIKTGTYYPETKEAGHRHFLARDEEGAYTCYGRRLNVDNVYIDIYPKIKDMKHPKLPRGTVLDMELVWPGHPDSEVVTAIKDCPAELECRVFGVPIFMGKDYRGLSYIDGRSAVLANVNKPYVTKRYKPVELTKANIVQKLTWLLNQAEAKGIEGFVLKSAHYSGWYKLKGINEADVICTGFKISDADTRKGMVTAVKVSVYFDGDNGMKYIGNVSGFDLDEMNAMTNEYNMAEARKLPESNRYIGRPLQIIYQEMASQNGLKHGFFDRWRDDKNPLDCNLEQFS